MAPLKNNQYPTEEDQSQPKGEGKNATAAAPLLKSRVREAMEMVGGYLKGQPVAMVKATTISFGKALSSHPNFSMESIGEWLEANMPRAIYPCSFVDKFLTTAVDEGKFDEEEDAESPEYISKHLNFWWMTRMYIRGECKWDEEATREFVAIEEQLVANGVDIDVLRSLNDSMISLLMDKNAMSFRNMLLVLRKSKTAKSIGIDEEDLKRRIDGKIKSAKEFEDALSKAFG